VLVEKKNRYVVFAVRKTDKGATIWSRAGNAWVNRDDSVNIYLDVLPISGRLHIREVPEETKRAVDAQLVVPNNNNNGAALAAQPAGGH